MQKKNYLFLFLIILCASAGLFLYKLPMRVEIKESVIVRNNAQGVYEEVANLQNMVKWYPYVVGEKKAKVEFDQKTGIGSKLFWTSADGTQYGNTTLFRDSGSRYKKLMWFQTSLSRFENTAWEEFYIEEFPAGSTVTWNFKIEFSESIWSRFRGWMSENEIRTNLQKGLANLRNQVEARPKFNTFISTNKFDRFYYLSTNEVIVANESELPLQKEALFQKLYQYLANHSLNKEGNRIIFKDRTEDGKIKLTCGIGLRHPLKVEGSGMRLDSLPEGRAVVAEMQGAHKSLDAFYEDVNEYISYSALTAKGKSWEEEFVAIHNEKGVPERMYIIQPVAD